MHGWSLGCLKMSDGGQRARLNPSVLESTRECCLADALAWAAEPPEAGMDKGCRLAAELERLNEVGDPWIRAQRAAIAERKATVVRILHDDLGLTFRQIAERSNMSINRPRQVYLNGST